MTASRYIQEIRAQIGHSLLLIPSVAAVIADPQKRILLQQKADDSWSLPAGMIEPGESPAEAMVREVKEETGLVVVPSTLLGVFGGAHFRHTYPTGDQVEYTVILMKCSIVDVLGHASDPETCSLAYFDKQSMPELALPYPKDVLFEETRVTFIQ